MRLYRVIFKGQRQHPYWTPFPTQIKAIVQAPSIYDVAEKLAERYDFISGLCIFSPDHFGDTSIMELR